MNLDYTLLNEPTALLQRLADAEAKLVAVRTLPEKWINSVDMLPDVSGLKLTVTVCAGELQAKLVDEDWRKGAHSDLVKELRDAFRLFPNLAASPVDLFKESADRIEELEAHINACGGFCKEREKDSAVIGDK